MGGQTMKGERMTVTVYRDQRKKRRDEMRCLEVEEVAKQAKGEKRQERLRLPSLTDLSSHIYQHGSDFGPKGTC